MNFRYLYGATPHEMFIHLILARPRLHARALSIRWLYNGAVLEHSSSTDAILEPTNDIREDGGRTNSPFVDAGAFCRRRTAII